MYSYNKKNKDCKYGRGKSFYNIKAKMFENQQTMNMVFFRVFYKVPIIFYIYFTIII